MKLKYDQTLMAGIGFTEEELEANRAGQMSDRQRKNLTQKHQNLMFHYAKSMATVGVIISAFVVIVIIIIIERPIPENDMPIAVGIFAVIFPLLIGLLYLRGQRRNRLRSLFDDYTEIVAMVEDRVKLNVGGDYTFYIIVGDITLDVYKAAFLAFKNGDPYAIYYAPHSKTLLSAEWLREG